jgi:cytoskeletal protein RodZ
LTGTPTLGTAAALDVGILANNVVQLNGSAQLPAVDGSLLTNLPSATVAALNDIGDVSAAAPTNGQVIAYNSTSGDWEAADQTNTPATVSVSSPATNQTLSAPSGIEEVYIYTPSAPITVNLASASSCGTGFRYQIKNNSANTITVDPNLSETIDGSLTFALSTQYASLTIVTDGSNWFII